jgi:hypothetical protein
MPRKAKLPKMPTRKWRCFACKHFKQGRPSKVTCPVCGLEHSVCPECKKVANDDFVILKCCAS